MLWTLRSEIFSVPMAPRERATHGYTLQLIIDPRGITDQFLDSKVFPSKARRHFTDPPEKTPHLNQTLRKIPQGSQELGATIIMEGHAYGEFWRCPETCPDNKL